MALVLYLGELNVLEALQNKKNPISLAVPVRAQIRRAPLGIH